MATTFLEIYTRSMNLFKSPRLSRLQLSNLQAYCMIMNGYLQFAISMYNPSKEVESRLKDQTAPSQLISMLFTGNGIDGSFELTKTPKPDNNAIFKVTLDGKVVEEDLYTYDEDTGFLIFADIPTLDTEIQISWYNSGQFNTVLTASDITLLSMAIVWGWAIQISNDELDIIGLPSDTDFRLHSEAQRTRAKSEWVKMYEEMYKRELSKTEWRGLFRRYR